LVKITWKRLRQLSTDVSSLYNRHEKAGKDNPNEPIVFVPSRFSQLLARKETQTNSDFIKDLICKSKPKMFRN